MSDWNYYVYSWDFDKLALAGFPTWELQDKTPYCVFWATVVGKDRDSINIIREWDDLAKHNFKFRDMTDDNIPFVRDGEKHWTTVWFQKQTEAVRFQERYGGVGSWQARISFDLHEGKLHTRRSKAF